MKSQVVLILQDILKALVALMALLDLKTLVALMVMPLLMDLLRLSTHYGLVIVYETETLLEPVQRNSHQVFYLSPLIHYQQHLYYLDLSKCLPPIHID